MSNVLNAKNIQATLLIKIMAAFNSMDHLG